MAETVFIFENCRYESSEIKKHIEDSGVLSGIRRGQSVVLKPNFVQESRDRSAEWEHIITHPALITAVLDMVSARLEGEGRISLLDGPMTGSSFPKIMAHMPAEDWKKMCQDRNIAFEIIDLREETWTVADNGIVLERSKAPGDPRGKTMVDLKTSSAFYGITPVNGYYGADYDTRQVNAAHNGTNNRYSVSASVLAADVIINLPKMKTHKKAGITCSLKNMVGVNTNKNYLPHHQMGTPREGGDQFSNSVAGRAIEGRLTGLAKRIMHTCRFLAPLFVPLKKLGVKVWGDNRQTIRNGAWYGNDTLWRTILDLNTILYYANADGSMREDAPESRKQYVSIVDGILAGEGNGPMDADCVSAGVLLCGKNPVAVDCVAAKRMGFDYAKIPALAHAFACRQYKLIDCAYAQILCKQQGREALPLASVRFADEHRFRAPLGWEGNIELP